MSDVELLAPAGCFASLAAGIEAGADAVYFGVEQLNMRAKARRTFQLEDIGEIAARCQAGGVSAYLALNTLLYDHDLGLAGSILDQAQEAGIDAVIVADVAAMQGAYERGIEVHLSTQLSVSNYQSFKFYSQWCDRIVLARELSLALIKRLHRQIISEDNGAGLRGPRGRLMEIEAFAHGALCVAISGRCGMSLFTDNASANRGACKQNCRKEYLVTEVDSGKQLKVDNNFIMSPNDIATLDFLDEVVGAGIKVLKLEGRGRSPEYVHEVVRAYRRGLEAVKDKSFAPALGKDLLQGLDRVYNRGFSSAYYLGRKQGWSRASGSRATRQKVEVGKVTNYFAKLGVAEVACTASGLRLGDEYVIVGGTTGVVSGTVAEMRTDTSDNVVSVAPSAVFSLAVPCKVRRNDVFYLMRNLDVSSPLPAGQAEVDPGPTPSPT